MTFNGGLNAFHKPKGNDWYKGADILFGTEEEQSTKEPYDPFHMYKTTGARLSQARKDLSTMRDNLAYRESEQGKRDFLQPFDDNGRVNQEFAKVHGEEALKSAERQINIGYKHK